MTREEGRGVQTPDGKGFLAEPHAPFRLDLTAWALRRRAHNTIDRFDAGTYRRALLIGKRLLAFQSRSAARLTRRGSRCR